jgi:hypothetical protein
MNVINYRVSLDMLDTSSQATIKAKKGDSACKIYITLSQNGKIYKMSEGSHATFSAKKADGTFVLYDNCAIEGDSIVYDFLSSVNEDGCQITACEGTVECEVTLFNGSEQLTSPRFTLVVDGTVYNGEEIKSSDEFNFLEDLIQKAEDTVQKAEDTVSEIEEKLANGEFNGKDAVTDQEFSPASENAQSGKAVSQAIAYYTFNELTPEMYGQDVSGTASPSAVVNYVNNYVAENGGGGSTEVEWEFIYETTSTSAVTKISQKIEGLGDTSKGVRVAVYLPANTTLKNNRMSLTASLAGSNTMAVYASDWATHSTETLCVFEVKPKGLVWDIEVAPYTRVFSKLEASGCALDINPKVRYVAITTGDPGFPAGTTMKVWRLK